MITEQQLILIKPDESYAKEISSYRKEMLDANSSMDGCGSLRSQSDPQKWIQDNHLFENKETLPVKDWVAASQYVCVRTTDHKIVGMIQVRHYFNDYLEKYAGHIGYSVRPSERRKGYAKWMLHAILPVCRDLELDRILITCLKDNEGSRKTILANNGFYENTIFEPDEKVFLERYWINLIP